MSSKFCIVHFIEEESVEVVPDFWIFKSSETSYCSWPLNNAFPTKCVKNRTVPDEKWPFYKCRILYSFGDYKIARRHLTQAEITSDFTDKSEVVKKRIHKPNRKYVSDSSESSKSSKDTNTKYKYKESSIKKEIPQSSKESKCSEMDLPKTLRQKSNRILDVNQNLSSMPSRRNSAARSRSPLNKADENVDQLQEDITSQGEFNMSGTVMQENQLTAEQIQAQSTEKITKKTRYNGETEFEKQIVRDLTIIKFDMRAILEIVTTLSQTWIEKNEEINLKTSTGKEKSKENILPTFPLENWQNFLDLENLLQTKNIARAQL
ncbi:e3 ubiquitin-protein ligase protein, partial [Lasius niger]